MKKWLKIYGYSIFMMIIALYLLYNNIWLLINRRGEIDNIYAWEFIGIYTSLLMLLIAPYELFKANGKERIINIIHAISGGIMFISWLIIMFVFGDSIDLIDTLMIFGASILLLVVSIARLHGVNKESLIVKKLTLSLALVLIVGGIITILFFSGIF